MTPPSRRSVAAALGLLGLGLAALVPATASAGPAPDHARGPVIIPTRTVPMGPAAPANPSNPLADRPWGVYQGPADGAWIAYDKANGARKKALSTIALTPKAKFYGAWISDADIAAKMRAYVDSASGGDPDVLVQFALFRMVPWENEACTRLPSKGERASYKRYVDDIARVLGNQHTAVVLQPDGPFLRCVPHHSKVPAGLLAYAARTLSAQPNVSVYVEMGSADWFRDQPADAVHMLEQAGVAHARGFALDTSHFDSVGRQIDFGKKIARALAADGIRNRHFVIDTSDSGHPFTGAWYHAHHRAPLDHAKACTYAGQIRCVALGVPPTTDVGSARWGLSQARRTAAEHYVDGYLWVGRPWITNQSGSFNMSRALAVVRYSPYH